MQLDLATGTLSPEGGPTETVSPSFLALHPNRRFLYAVNETGESHADPGGAVSAFAMEPRTGGPTFLNPQPSGGAAPCHLSVDREGRHLLVANYWGGSFAYVINELDATVTAFAHDAAAGSLTEIQTVSTLPAGWQGENSTAEVVVRPDGSFLYRSNRGHDSLAIFAIDAPSGRLTSVGHQSTPRAHAAALRDRPERDVPPHREPGIGHGRGLPDRPHRRPASRGRQPRPGPAARLSSDDDDRDLTSISPSASRSPPPRGDTREGGAPSLPRTERPTGRGSGAGCCRPRDVPKRGSRSRA